MEALIELVRQYGIKQIQFRNLNCDPKLMQPFCAGKKPLSMRALLQRLQFELPEVKIGNYSCDLLHLQAEESFPHDCQHKKEKPAAAKQRHKRK